MYIDNISMDKIIEKTKLDEKTIEKVIEKKKEKNDDNSDIIEIKNDIKELKILMKKMNEMIKAIYQFENS